MCKMISTGKVGNSEYLITQNDSDVTATITTQDDVLEVSRMCWADAQRWVDKIITRINEIDNESRRDY